MSSVEIEPGATFGRLTVIASADDRIRIEEGRERRYPMAHVVCSCGNQRVVYLSNLRRGLSTSCGCLTAERSREVKRASRTSRPGYELAHIRMRKDRGPARNHTCPFCNERAAHWAYTHTDPDELVEGSLPYSTSYEHYVAMCRKCHKHYDRLASHVRNAGIYPSDLFATREVTVEQAEQMRQAMPTPDAFEIVEEGP